MSKNRITRRMIKKYNQSNPWMASVPIVAEQPGLRVSAVGILISVVLSFMLQGYFSETRIQEKFRPLLRQIHPDLSFDFESIHLSLRNGFVPRTAIVMQKVKILVNNKCLLNTVMEINEVVLPFSVARYIVGVNPIDEIRLGKVKTVLGSHEFGCQEVNSELSAVPSMLQGAEAKKTPETLQPKVSIAESVSDVKSTSQIQRVNIESLEIYRANDMEPILSIGDLIFDLLSEQPKHISLSSKLNLFQENRGIDYFSQGELEAQYREFPEKKIDLSLVGHIREGSYRFEGSLLLSSMEFHANADIQHIPIYPFLNLMRKLNIAQFQVPVGKVWTSFQAESEGSLSQMEKSKLNIRPLVVEGDFGSIRSESIAVENFVQWKFSEFKVTSQNLALDQLFDAQVIAKYFPFIHSLGTFQGSMQYSKENEFQISGIHNGLEFIFSNLGQRQMQKIDNLILSVSGKNHIWQLDVPRMDLEDGIFAGKVHILYAPQEKTTELKCDIDEIVFSNEVQNVMTSGGKIGSASINYQGKWKDYRLQQHTGHLKVLSSNIFGVDVGKTSLRINSKEAEDNLHSLVHLQMSNMKIDVQNVLAQKFFLLTGSSSEKANAVLLKEATGDFDVESLHQLSWSNVSIFHPKGKIQSQGGWRPNGDLFGTVSATDFFSTSGKAKKWNISGRRDAPVFEQ